MGQGSIIGYEINEKTCQISFYNEKDLEPDTLLRSKTDLPQRDF